MKKGIKAGTKTGLIVFLLSSLINFSVFGIIFVAMLCTEGLHRSYTSFISLLIMLPFFLFTLVGFMVIEIVIIAISIAIAMDKNNKEKERNQKYYDRVDVVDNTSIKQEEAIIGNEKEHKLRFYRILRIIIMIIGVCLLAGLLSLHDQFNVYWAIIITVILFFMLYGFESINVHIHKIQNEEDELDSNNDEKND